MTELTDWERRRLDLLGRHLAQEDPRLAARLTGTGRTRRVPRVATLGWAMFWAGLPLAMCGVLLGIGWMIAVAFVLLSTCWVPILGRFGARTT